MDVKASNEVEIDRSLDSSLFRSATGWRPPSWQEMIAELAADPTPYDRWRKAKVE
jgi:dTDP-4-dehydrorhamnose reductase